jgi:hypothetical protein
MNTDDFEQRLQHQPLRQVPAQWREEILVAADVNRRSAAAQPIPEHRAALFTGWRLLLARLPIAWAALAALWVVLIGVNMALPGPTVTVAKQNLPSARLSLLAGMDLKRAELELLSDEFSLATENVQPVKAPAVPPRPRSERRRDVDFGEAHWSSMFDTVV